MDWKLHHSDLIQLAGDTDRGGMVTFSQVPYTPLLEDMLEGDLPRELEDVFRDVLTVITGMVCTICPFDTEIFFLEPLNDHLKGLVEDLFVLVITKLQLGTDMMQLFQ